MRFDDPFFLLVFLPALFASTTRSSPPKASAPRLAAFGAKAAAVVLLAGSVWLLARSPVGWLLLGSAFVTILLAATGEQLRTHPCLCIALRAGPGDDGDRCHVRDRPRHPSRRRVRAGGRLRAGVSGTGVHPGCPRGTSHHRQSGHGVALSRAVPGLAGRTADPLSRHRSPLEKPERRRSAWAPLRTGCDG